MAKYLSFAGILFILANGFADDPLTPKEIQFSSETTTDQKVSSPIEKKAIRKSPTVKAAFSPFTGKVTGDHVRMRLQPDLEGYIVRELRKSDLVTVIDQEGDFYCIEPGESLKAYVFRSFVLDGVVEGNRVNVRLEPDLEAPVIGHLNSGDKVNGHVSSINRKWLEIDPPNSTRFYVAKDFIHYVGGPEVKGKIAKRKELVQQLFDGAVLYSKTELEKTFDEIDFDKVKQGFLNIINDYTDFPKKVETAKLELVQAQEKYLEKRIAHLEEKAAQPLHTDVAAQQNTNPVATPSLNILPTRTWQSIEQALFASWAQAHSEGSLDEFYDQQKQMACAITGTVEPFKSPVKNKPGDFVLKNKNLPVAYVYSTDINLEEYAGKEVTLIGAPRDNHNFAFPAYFVLEVE